MDDDIVNILPELDLPIDVLEENIRLKPEETGVEDVIIIARRQTGRHQASVTVTRVHGDGELFSVVVNSERPTVVGEIIDRKLLKAKDDAIEFVKLNSELLNTFWRGLNPTLTRDAFKKRVRKLPR